MCGEKGIGACYEIPAVLSGAQEILAGWSSVRKDEASREPGAIGGRARLAVSPGKRVQRPEVVLCGELFGCSVG